MDGSEPDPHEGGTALPALPDRPGDGHKGTFGTVIVVGGSATMIGAPALAARAALRSGAGLVKLATPADVLPHAIVIEPGATGIALADDPEMVVAQLAQADPDEEAVLAVGPGMGQGEAAASLVSLLLAGRRRVVLDADGLNVLASLGRAHDRHGAKLVLTPHPGEFRRLAKPLGIELSATGPDQRPEAARALAKAHHAVVVLKGRHSIITDGEQTHLNRTGNPALATAGSGDVLTGLIAGLIAQGMSLFEAAVLGAHLHGLAGDCWAARHGPRGLRAQDLSDMLLDAFDAMR